MTRYLLDTNIISDVTRPRPSPRLLEWMAEQADERLFVSTLTIAEVRRGILELPAGRRRRDLEEWFAGADGPSHMFGGRVLSFDERAALFWADLMAAGRASGRSRSALDMIVAAVARANDCVVVTANSRHFSGIEHINPLAKPAQA